MTAVLTRERALHWCRSWDRLQEVYGPHRSRRWDALVAELAGVPAVRRRPGESGHPAVVDLGCGPGTLTARLAAALPGSVVVGVDADPFLVALARAAFPGGRWAVGRFGPSGLSVEGGAPVPDRIAAFVASATLHYLDADRLRDTAAVLRGRLAAGGVLLNADRLPASAAPFAQDEPRPDGDRAPSPWERWWAAAAADPVLGPVLARHPRDLLPAGDHPLSVAEHLVALRAAGYPDCREVWRHDDCAVVRAG